MTLGRWGKLPIQEPPQTSMGTLCCAVCPKEKMIFKLKCKSCNATCWARGWEEYDTNAWGIDDNEELEWENGNPDCPHLNWSCVDQDYQSDED